MHQLKGKVYIVTGVAAREGQEQARALIDAGASVVLADADAATARALARALGARALYVAGEVQSEEGWWSVVRGTLDRFGRLDGVINDGSIHDADDDEEPPSYQRAVMPAVGLVRPCHPNCPDCRAINAIAA